MGDIKIDGIVYPTPKDYADAMRQNGILLHKLKFMKDIINKLHEEKEVMAKNLLVALGAVLVNRQVDLLEIPNEDVEVAETQRVFIEGTEKGLTIRVEAQQKQEEGVPS